MRFVFLVRRTRFFCFFVFPYCFPFVFERFVTFSEKYFTYDKKILHMTDLKILTYDRLHWSCNDIEGLTYEICIETVSRYRLRRKVQNASIGLKFEI